MIDLSKRWPLGLERRQAPFWIAAAAVVIGLLLMVDHRVSVAAQSLPAPVIAFFEWLTRWGESDWILLPSAALLLLSLLAVAAARQHMLKLAALEQAAVFGFIFAGVGLPSVTSTMLKRLIGRARPGVFNQVGDFNFHFNWSLYDYQSFPSGHTTTAFSLAVVVAFLSPRLLWPALVYAFGIAASRVILGQHYLSDVTAGALLGITGAHLVRNWFASRGWAFRQTASGPVARTAALRRLLLRRRK